MGTPVSTLFSHAPQRLSKTVFALALVSGVFFSSQAASAGLELFATSDLERVFEDGYGTPSRIPALKLFGLRDEIVSAQCVLVAHENLERVTVSLAPLKAEPGTSTIPEESIRWNFVGGIYIEKNSPNRPKADVLRPGPAWFPDVLTEERQCSMTNGMRKAVYLTIKIPADAPHGEYRTTVTAKTANASASLPLTLQVFPLSLPKERHLFVTEWFSTYNFKKHHQVDPANQEEFWRLLKTYALNMAEHRQNAFRVSLGWIESRRDADGKLQFYFAKFDQLAQVFWDTGRMDLLETGFVAGFGKGGWSGSEVVLSQFPVKEANGRSASMAGKEFLPQFLPALVAHLREKGWLAKSVFHICDEPSGHNVIAWRDASEFVHTLAPQLRRIDAIETPLCLGALEVWVPKLDHLATWHETYEQAQQKGNELWFYTVGIFQGGALLNKTADVPLIETRLMHWLNYRYDLRGYLHWGFNEWTDDPISNPGEHRGDGWHVYPKKAGLLDSLRWEQMRNGLQDYECLWLLENRIAQLKGGMSARAAALIDVRQRGVELCSKVVANYYEHTSSPEVLYQVKREVIEETLALEQSPVVLLQTIPPEHSPVAKGCAIDLHGWAEPGTTLTANGEAVTVAPDGLFTTVTAVRPDGKIVVEAKGKNGKKILQRQFREVVPSSPARGF